MKGFEVCDNFIEEDYFEHIESQMERCWWSLQEQVAYKGDVLNDKSFYFVHPIFDENHQKSEMHDTLSSLYTLLGVRALIRTRAIMYMNQGEQIIHSPHVDMTYSHKAALLYMNDNNGFTLMADDDVDINAYQDKEFKSPIEFTRKDDGGDIFSQQLKCMSKRNRLCIHDGSRPHCSSTPTNTKKRVLIAVNYF